MKIKVRALYFLSCIIVGLIISSLVYQYFRLSSNKNVTIRGPAIVPDKEGCYIKLESGGVR